MLTVFSWCFFFDVVVHLQAAEYRLRENAHVWVELKKDYDTVFNADAYRRYLLSSRRVYNVVQY